VLLSVTELFKNAGTGSKPGTEIKAQAALGPGKNNFGSQRWVPIPKYLHKFYFHFDYRS
jgi:hypothetical protein